MIAAKDKNGIYRTVSRMYSGGKEIAEVRDNSGRLVFRNWDELTGIPPLTCTSRSGYLKDYRIYGSTIQNGEPSLKNPVDVRGCGEYDSEVNGYKIPVTVTNGTDSITAPVYIGSEPLHKIGDYADYVDYQRGVVVRRIGKYVADAVSKKAITVISKTSEYARIQLNTFYPRNITPLNPNGFMCDVIPKRTLPNGISVGGNTAPFLWLYYDTIGLEYSENLTNTQIVSATNELLLQNNLTIWYALAEPEEETIALPQIQTIKGTNILTADTEVQPSKMYIKYKK